MQSRMKNWIPIARPAFLGNEKRYVLDCIESQWISSIGKYINRFEEAFAHWCGADHAVSLCNGTAALHVALLALGLKPGDEVIVPTLTFVATVNAVKMCGATPVFVDSSPTTWNLDPNQVASAITDRTRGIIPVHLYGTPADMEAITRIAKTHHLFVVEDAAEAHGAKVGGRLVGVIGDVGVFSFFGNKILTTGEGGMVVTRNPTIAAEMRLLKGQGQDPNRRYWFPIIGYNYRMTNVAAAIGLAQLEKVEDHLAARAELEAWYRKYLNNVPGLKLQRPTDGTSSVCWLFTVELDSGWPARDEVMVKLAERGIETRPVFYPIHTLPPYRSPQSSFPIAEKIAANGMNLPTWYGLTEEMVAMICEALATIREEFSRKAA